MRFIQRPPSTPSQGKTHKNNDASQMTLSSYYLMPFIISQGISSAETFQDPNSTQYKALLWISQNSVLSESDTPSTDKKTLINKDLHGLLMLYHENIESDGAQHSFQGTMYEQSSNPSQGNYFEPNLLDDFRTASDNRNIMISTGSMRMQLDQSKTRGRSRSREPWDRST
jgi:hypothetical protein